MTERYTAADFANAQFAEHESGQAVAIRWTQDYAREPDGFWTYERPLNNKFSKEATHQEMVDMGGWVPVPTNPTITESRFIQLVDVCSFADGPASYREFCRLAGLEVIPDPEPTNTERLVEIFKEIDRAIGLGAAPKTIADFLNERGVTAPELKDN